MVLECGHACELKDRLKAVFAFLERGDCRGLDGIDPRRTRKTNSPLLQQQTKKPKPPSQTVCSACIRSNLEFQAREGTCKAAAPGEGAGGEGGGALLLESGSTVVGGCYCPECREPADARALRRAPLALRSIVAALRNVRGPLAAVLRGAAAASAEGERRSAAAAAAAASASAAAAAAAAKGKRTRRQQLSSPAPPAAAAVARSSRLRSQPARAAVAKKRGSRYIDESEEDGSEEEENAAADESVSFDAEEREDDDVDDEDEDFSEEEGEGAKGSARARRQRQRQRQRGRSPSAANPRPPSGSEEKKARSAPGPLAAAGAPLPEGTVRCPSCGGIVGEALINAHLDSCLSKAATTTNGGGAAAAPGAAGGARSAPPGASTSLLLPVPPKLCLSIVKDKELKDRLRGLGVLRGDSAPAAATRRPELERLYRAFRLAVVAANDAGGASAVVGCGDGSVGSAMRELARRTAGGGGAGRVSAPAAGGPAALAEIGRAHV